MRFIYLLQVLLGAGAAYALTEDAQATCPERLNKALDDYKDALADLDICEKTPHGPIYEKVDCSTFTNGNVRARGDEVYKIFCQKTNGGKNLKTKKITTFEECMDYCDVSNGCVGGDYYPGDQDCFLKSTGMSDGTIVAPSKGNPIAFYNIGYI
ncbi:hypothetical protein FE257_004506 [Aspergillus nanangensis]|uniref:Apple domain-containing protein n=1 Tax=Aspergillus nanangensis TaxID=2582783 RepID=A0AAD4CY60_ASPNN|nr:hypothetical protein FE257_004506 [Aspergillus nanangensis]